MKENGKLIGALGAHVGDTATGGSGSKYTKASGYLRQRFPYRKWRMDEGEFCGDNSQQDPSSMSIKMSQKSFADALRPAHLPQRRKANRHAKLDAKEISVLRGINGSLNWLSTQSRPDIAAQTSVSQQSFPEPTVHHLLEANNVIRRAKQFSDLDVTFEPIPVDQLRLFCHSDAAWANVGAHTQAGYVIGLTTADLDVGIETTWTPAIWKSFRLSRAVGSTLAAEAQSMVAATGTLEWTCLLLAEAIEGIGEIREYEQHLKSRTPVIVTDCKSLYDHLVAVSSPTSVEDRRTSIDIVILRQSMSRLSASIRWVPTNRMLADSLTKSAGDPTDLLRACIRNHTCQSYQISSEESVLKRQAEERKRRVQFRNAKGSDSSSKQVSG